MNNRPTPETDAAEWFWYGDCAPEEEMIVPADLAKKLERERDEAREALESEKKWHNQTHKELIEAKCKLLDIEYDKLKS